MEKSCKSTASVTLCISCGWNIGPGTFCGFRHTPTHLDPFSLTGDSLQKGHSSLVGLNARLSMTCISTSSADAMVPGKYPDPATFLSSDPSDEDEDARNSAGIVLRAVFLLAAVLLILVDEVDVAGTDAVDRDVEVDAAVVIIPRIDYPDCCANCPL